MSKSLLSALFCFFLTITAFTGPGAAAAGNPSGTDGEGGCNLAAPASFYVVSAGTNFITVGWSPVTGAIQYRIKVKNLTTNTPVSDQFVASIVFTQTGLAPGNNYEFKIYSVCSNGVASELYNSLEKSAIIIDLVLQGSNYSSSLASCHGSSSPVTCTFSNTTNTAFWVEVRLNNSTYLARYKITIASDGSFKVGHVDSGSGTNYQELSSLTTTNEKGQYPDDPYDEVLSERIDVFSTSESAVGTFTISTEGSTGSVIGTVASGYSFWVLTPASSPEGFVVSDAAGSPGTYDSAAEDRQNAIPSPALVVNPFSATLDVFFPDAIQASTALHLFSLDGREQRQEQFPAGTTHCSLPTADLPKGLYLLRIESGGRTETFKVIKTD